MLLGIFRSGHTVASLQSARKKLESAMATHKVHVSQAIADRQSVIAQIRDELQELEGLR